MKFGAVRGIRLPAGTKALPGGAPTPAEMKKLKKQLEKLGEEMLLRTAPWHG